MKHAPAYLVFLLWATVSFAADIHEGMTRREVEAELGKPLSVMTLGETTILNYPNRGRVELVRDRVTESSRVRKQGDPSTRAGSEAAAAVKVSEEERVKLAAEAEAAAQLAKANATADAAAAKAAARARRQMELAVENLSAEHGNQAGPMAESLMPRPEPAHFWLALAVGLIVQIGVGVVVLKLAFRWADVHADWDQMVWLAVAAAFAGAAVRTVAYTLWGITECFYVDDAISYFALLMTLMKTTHACTWQRAVAVAVAAKLMTLIVWVFLSVAIMRLLFT